MHWAARHLLPGPRRHTAGPPRTTRSRPSPLRPGAIGRLPASFMFRRWPTRLRHVTPPSTGSGPRVARCRRQARLHRSNRHTVTGCGRRPRPPAPDLLGAQLAYLAARFRWRLGSSAVAALAHDVVILIGVFAWLGKPVDGVFLAALLTVIGYSVNDSVVASTGSGNSAVARARSPSPATPTERSCRPSPDRQHRHGRRIHPHRTGRPRRRHPDRLRPRPPHRPRSGHLLLDVHCHTAGHRTAPAHRGRAHRIPEASAAPAAEVEDSPVLSGGRWSGMSLIASGEARQGHDSIVDGTSMPSRGRSIAACVSRCQRESHTGVTPARNAS